jgi:hypothetical protein
MGSPRRLLSRQFSTTSVPANEVGRTLKKAFLSYDFPTEFVKWNEIAADRNHGVLFAIL